MTNRLMMTAVLGIALWAWGCGASIKAPTMAGGKKITIQVLSDRGITEGMPQDMVDQRNQLGQWMENDLIDILKDAGYEAAVIQKREEFKAEAGKYLLAVKIVKYNPGSKAARMVVGFGAGAASLDTHYDLFGDAADPILAKDHGVGSGRDWNYCARKLNEDMTKAVSDKLAEINK